ncbi:hypothetical protein H6G97_37705 [Nostoc flagelliforme FACHB-838]|uniref:Uncharacterized protein n=1 Tax=Nostoc flagelliforme FACHB-838 TaxID=2692904 RepID=A0ABR8DZE6_9NOSO|nr:hypothetical protein [Nostoc flagelliforme]MBD2534872.1 hypothetical protein [Nostoc flagelliforme FACHB-838]
MSLSLPRHEKTTAIARFRHGQRRAGGLIAGCGSRSAAPHTSILAIKIDIKTAILQTTTALMTLTDFRNRCLIVD